MNTFDPLSDQPPPVRSARVCTAARSLPPPGSVRAAAVSTDPSQIAGSQRSRWAPVPKRVIDPATSELVTETTDATTQSMRASSSQITP